MKNRKKRLNLDSFCPKNKNLTFGDIIKYLRENRNLTLREVSHELNVEISMLGKIEKNNRTPTAEFIEKVSRFYNINNDDLKIAYLSDIIVNQILQEEDLAIKILNVVQEKLKIQS